MSIDEIRERLGRAPDKLRLQADWNERVYPKLRVGLLGRRLPNTSNEAEQELRQWADDLEYLLGLLDKLKPHLGAAIDGLWSAVNIEHAKAARIVLDDDDDILEEHAECLAQGHLGLAQQYISARAALEALREAL